MGNNRTLEKEKMWKTEDADDFTERLKQETE
jgi:hypothetical protein